ncbi:MAG: anthranilate synthase component I family protein [Flavobacteriales bacterium]|nr:anthranilate synthase component I family protein [Flavobacteriales bacterium]MDW8432299.1 anthranilate synthase component I family protein [Flavobacteriales bacterium]
MALRCMEALDIEKVFEKFPVVALFHTGGPPSAYCRQNTRLMAGSRSWDSPEKMPKNKTLILGVAYEWKDTVENLVSLKPDRMGWPLFQATEAELDLELDDWQPRLHRLPSTGLRETLSRKDYLETLWRIQKHIHRGDIYEINFCMELQAQEVKLLPMQLFENLCYRSPAPMSVLYKWHHLWVVSSSPERFLARRGQRLISQPMKGTAPRRAEPLWDAEEMRRLKSSPKERMENTMIVDLVRNDLSRVCQPGSVRVREWCGLYSFSHVHQMISTVEGELQPGKTFGDILRALFPPGSMTGAPKIRAMQLAEEYETSRRGMYSGTIGFMEKSGDFDLNVVIRSVAYNAQTGLLSCHVGSAITHLSQPEQEWEECLWKAAAIQSVLNG